jgi:dolichol-phosphate mannosyltransferase
VTPDAPVAWVCVPTYNERENVEALVTQVRQALVEAGIDGHVLVVDDGSPDGTGQIADDMAARDDRVHVLHRTSKEGIGPAYRAGFRHALANGAGLILEMDCDFSHDPRDVPRLIAAARGADVVLGSRYVPGGGVAEWGIVRRAISRGGCLYAQAWIGTSVKDLTGGFKCFRREVLEAIPLDEVSGAGYVFQVEMTYRALLQGFSVVEVPITFTDRTKGQSKMSRGIVMEAAVLVPRLRLRLGPLAARSATSARDGHDRERV